MDGQLTRALAAGVLGQALAGAPPSRGVLLRIATGPEQGHIVPVAPGDVLGRGSSVQVALADPAASREHARVERWRDGFSIVNLGSKNGLVVNGRLVKARAAIRDGDRVVVGSTALDVAIREAGAAAGDVEPAPPASVVHRPWDGRRLAWGALLAAGAAVLVALA